MRSINFVFPFFAACFVAAFFCAPESLAQVQKPNSIAVTSINKPTAAKVANPVVATAAYAEIYASKVEAEVDLKVLTMDATEDAPQVRAKMLERDLLERQIRWLEILPPASLPKLTQALGRLAVRKAQAEANLKIVSQNYAENHPTVKKARARLDVYSSEMEKLLQ